MDYLAFPLIVFGHTETLVVVVEVVVARLHEYEVLKAMYV